MPKLFAAVTFYGCLFTLAVFIAACYHIGTTDYAPNATSNETFWCDVAG